MTKHIILSILLALVFQSCTKKETLQLYQVDPLKKVLKEQTYFRDRFDTIRVARGEYASIQIVAKGLDDIKDMEVQVKEIRSANGNVLPDATAGWVGYVYVGRSYNPPSDSRLRAASDYFPDPILPDSAFTIEKGEVQPLWITVPVRQEATPGIYKGTVSVSGLVNNKKHTWEKDFFIRVYPVTLGKSPLLISNWSAHTSPAVLGYLNNNEDVELYSPLYWELLEMHAEIMASHRQNMVRLFPIWRTLYTYKDGNYSFDFNRFDKEVEIFKNAGALEWIEGGHIAWRTGDFRSAFFVEVPVPDDEESRKLPASPNPVKAENGVRFVLLHVEDPRTQNFLTQFLPALKEHLEKKGWLDHYMQHIADEPTQQNAASYAEISKYIRRYMPGVKLMDAVTTSKELAGTIDVWIPLLSVLHHDYEFYKQLQDNGKDVWFYTCVSPRGNYANRFIEQPLIQTRYLHWINYKYGVTGYLHWGLNFWIKDQLHADQSRDHKRLPAGDNCVIYPGYKRLYTSIRFETMRDGIDDYQLLKMLEEKDPAKAKSLVDSVILNFNHYDESIWFFRNLRKRLLEALCE